MKSVISPCITVCKTDPISGFCYGCGRSSQDKQIWADPETKDEWKLNNLEIIRQRLNGWQQIAFDESYAFKQKNGISLIKKKITESKK